MATPVTMPMLGLTMEEGTVAAWLKQEGDAIEKDEPLLTVEMDKGTLDVPSPAAGVLRRILVPVGQTVAIRTPIAEILSRRSHRPSRDTASRPGTPPERRDTSGQVSVATATGGGSS